MTPLLMDLHYAARMLVRSPAFSLVAVLSLGLGIGATTALFSVVNGVLLQPSPFENQDRLVVVWETDRNSGTTREPASLPDYVDFREAARSLDELAGFHAESLTLSGGDDQPQRLQSMAVTANLFPMLGIGAVTGRTFSEAEASPGGGNVVLIGAALRERLYGGADVLGRTLRLDGTEHTIVGVLPDGADFGMPRILQSAAYGQGAGATGVDLWTPLTASVEEWPRSTHPIFLLGRLAPGADRTVAQQELSSVAAELEARHSVNNGRGVYVEPLDEVVFASVRPALAMLLAAVVVVLLVACANVANLLLARGTQRAREIAVRGSLGADGTRLARQFLVEGLLLAFAGAAVGILLAAMGTNILLSLAPTGIPRLEDIGLDARVLLLTVGVSVLIGIVFGLMPLQQVRSANLQSALKSETGVGADPGRSLLRSGLVISELALAVVLVIGAGLLLRSFWQIQQVDAGFHAENVLKAEFTLPRSRYPVDFSAWPNLVASHRFNAALLERTLSLPGVVSAAIATGHPMDRGFTNSFTIAGREAELADAGEISIRSVTPGYFDTVMLAVTRGRALDATDTTDAPLVAMINEAAVKRLFADADPVGHRISFWGDERRIVGVVANEKFHGLTASAPIAVYTPLAQTPSVSGNEVFLVRTSGELATHIATVGNVIREIDPELAVFGVEPLLETVGRSVAEQRFTMLLLCLFAAVAIVLAAIGIHGVLNCFVARRIREMGLRMALGATPGRVLGLVARQGIVLAATGLCIGLIGAFAATSLMQSLLFGITATDPVTFIAVAIGVLGVAMLACWLPARRATSVDPMAALREE